MDTFPPLTHSKPQETRTYPVMRKAFIKLAAYYHLDKVGISIHGEKYKVLCEEIAKQVNEDMSSSRSEGDRNMVTLPPVFFAF